MDFNATVDLIIRELDEAREIIDDLKNYSGVPLIQVELAKSKCKNAAEIIALLKNLNTSVPPVEQKVMIKREPERTVKPLQERSDRETIHKKPHLKKDIPRQTSFKPGESAIVADTFGLTDRVNETIGGLREEDGVSELLKSKPLTNLSDAIGVNDKFLFIRELFNGNHESYNQAITRLDNAENLEDAKAVIMSYRGDNKETDAIKQLLELVKRKFPSDE